MEQYLKPEKRRGGKRQSAEQVAHKVAWAAVKNNYYDSRAKKRDANEENIKHSGDNEDPTDSLEQEETK